MTLTTGTKLGPYEIQSALGAGGMGEVYRARDTRLERSVAIKVLPPELSANVDRKQRFEREARTISSLNHPNICALYDVGSQDGLEFLVLEYVEGETLEKRLASGPLPTEILLRHGLEIADALEKAHRTGVIHRDLKPANIMLTKSGAKLLDFGLAKWSTAGASEEETLKTLTAGATRLTEQGTLLGTIQYMAPEQLEGKEADARTDLFAFGEVLYEMATARSAFAGKTKASLIASILSAEPTPISALQPMTPPALERLVRGCLAKDPEERWQTAHDVKLQLRAIAEGGSLSGLPAPVSARKRIRERLAWSAGALMTLLALVFAFGYFERAPSPPRAIRAYIKPAANSNFHLTGGQASGFALSPDGLRVAYVASTPEGKPLLWVRSLDSLQAQPLGGSENAAFPFWSPDSRFIGFFADGKLKKIEASGGPPLALCDAPVPRGGTWSRDGVIVFAPTINAPLHKVSASGGEATPITTLDSSKNETTHRWPYFLPDGRHFLYLAGTPFTPKESASNAIMAGSLDSKENKLLLHVHPSAIYASGHILFLRQNTLMAQPFDPKRLELTGEAFPIGDTVLEDSTNLRGVFSASENGRLAYLDGSSGGARQLIWLDRNGKKVGEVPGADSYNFPSISPDGKRIAYTLESSGWDVWSYDVARGVKTRLTFGSASSQANLSEVWSPDGRWIAYTCNHLGKFALCRKPSDGSGIEETLLEGENQLRYLNDWSADGKFLTYREALHGVLAVWMFPMSGERKPFPFRQSQFAQLNARFSPDSRWVAYCSNESGEFKVYVEPFPGPGGKWQVSAGSGCNPRWRRDGKELFYLSFDNKVMAADVRASGPSFEVGALHTLFETRPLSGILGNFDAAADGQRFIVVEELGQPTVAITLVVNWTSDLKK
jgi:eukaryotic-like serine/threonine-protein kinase